MIECRIVLNVLMHIYLQILNILIIRNMALSATPMYCDDSKK